MRRTWLVARYEYIDFLSSGCRKAMIVFLCDFFFLWWSSSSTGNPRLVPSVVRKNSIFQSPRVQGCMSVPKRGPKVALGGLVSTGEKQMT
jgi:hypothetical protein